MKKRQSSPASTKARSITSALPAAKRNLTQNPKSTRKQTGPAHQRDDGLKSNSFLFPDNLDIETGITLIKE
jgi:hypothetical protein